MQYKFDIDRKDLYEFKKPPEQTKARLTQIAELGLQEVGAGQFGLPGIMSGLYIELVWHHSEQNWIEYIEWIKGLIIKNKKDLK